MCVCVCGSVPVVEVPGRGRAWLGGGGGVAGAPEFEEVVGGGDELPFGLAGLEAAALEAVDAADELGVGEDGFDDLLAASVERLSGRCVQNRFDPLGFVALAG